MDVYDEIAKGYVELSVDYSKKLWAQYTTGFDFGVVEAKNKASDYLKSKSNYQKLLTLDKSQRKFTILERLFRDYHQSQEANEIQDQISILQNELSQEINVFRPELDGKILSSAERNQILRESDDSLERKSAYLSMSPLNKKLVDKGFLKLISLRNQLAQSLGYKNFVEYNLDSVGLSSEVIDLDGLNSEIRFDDTKNYYVKKSQELIGSKGFYSWDGAKLGSLLSPLSRIKVPPEKLNDYFRYSFNQLGFAEFNPDSVVLDLFGRKEKSEWAYNFGIELGKDCRVLANYEGRYSGLWTLLHELGHSLHFLAVEAEDYCHNLEISEIVAEGFANFCGNYSYQKESFEYLGIDLSDKDWSEIQDVVRQKRFGKSHSVAMMSFDMGLYLDVPSGLEELNERARKEYSKYFTIDDETIEIPWSKVIHHTTHPVYLHNYFMGDLFFNDLIKAGKINGAESASWIVENVLKESGKQEFGDLYESLLGKKFDIIGSLKSYLKD